MGKIEQILLALVTTAFIWEGFKLYSAPASRNSNPTGLNSAAVSSFNGGSEHDFYLFAPFVLETWKCFDGYSCYD